MQEIKIKVYSKLNDIEESNIIINNHMFELSIRNIHCKQDKNKLFLLFRHD